MARTCLDIESVFGPQTPFCNKLWFLRTHCNGAWVALGGYYDIQYTHYISHSLYVPRLVPDALRVSHGRQSWAPTQFSSALDPIPVSYKNCTVCTVFVSAGAKLMRFVFLKKLSSPQKKLTRCTCPPFALLCGPNVTAKGRLRITGHFGSGLVMPYPCFLYKDKLVWLMAMPVIQSRCLILDQTFSLSQPSQVIEYEYF